MARPASCSHPLCADRARLRLFQPGLDVCCVGFKMRTLPPSHVMHDATPRFGHADCSLGSPGHQEAERRQGGKKRGYGAAGL